MFVDKGIVAEYQQIMNTRKLEAVLGADSTALIKAVAKGRSKLTKLLVEGGADVNTRDGNGRSPLMVACMLKPSKNEYEIQLKIVKLLLEHGAQVNNIDKHGKTALIHACYEKADSKIIQTLLSYDADPHTLDHSGSSALVHAVDSGNAKSLTMLVEACKTKGKEVIIITTKESDDDKRETRQYLDVPPPFVKTSPSNFKCVAPKDIEFQISVKPEDNEQNNTSGGNEGHNITPLQPASSAEVENAILNLPVNNTSPPKKYPSLRRRESLGTIDLKSYSNILPEEPELEGSKPMVVCTTDQTRHVPPGRRRMLRRKQSSDNFNLDTEQTRSSEREAGEGGSTSSVCLMCQSMSTSHINSPEPRPPLSSPKPAGGRRRRSLPGMPPPLRKSQTIHAIRVPTYLLQKNVTNAPARSCPEDLHDTELPEEDESWDSGSSISDSKMSASGEIITPSRNVGNSSRVNNLHRLQRRGSAPFILDDELSQRRPGFLPPLKTNPDLPIPKIGCSFESDNKRRFSRLDRRCSFQADDLKRLSELFNSSVTTNDRSLSQSELNRR